MRVHLVAVGDELLVGDVVDTNSAELGRRLTDAGLRVTGFRQVGDDLEAVVEALREAAAGADALVVTGGLGPTSDDRTREALAIWARVPLCRDAAVEATLRRRYTETARLLTGTGLRQADVPAGARVLPNTAGTAPGLVVTVGDVVVYAVPGVPHEMRAVVEAEVLPDLVARAGAPGRRAVRVLRTAGVGEGVVAQQLAGLEAEFAGAVDVAYLAVPGETRVRLTSVRPGDDPAAAAAAARARDLLGDRVYGEGAITLAETVHRLLLARGATIAVAESLTGGLLAGELASVPGVSATFRGSVTAYATDVKAKVLGVDAALLAARGAVDPDVAAAMAEGVRALVPGTYGVATTGVAGPDPQDGKPVGTVHIAVSGPDGTQVASPLLVGDRGHIRAMTVVRALDLVRRAVLGLPVGPDRECTG